MSTTAPASPLQLDERGTRQSRTRIWLAQLISLYAASIPLAGDEDFKLVDPEAEAAERPVLGMGECGGRGACRAISTRDFPTSRARELEMLTIRKRQVPRGSRDDAEMRTQLEWGCQIGTAEGTPCHVRRMALIRRRIVVTPPRGQVEGT